MKKKLLSTLLSAVMLTVSLSTPAMAVIDYGAEYQNQPTTTYSQVFKDVNKSHWAFSYIGEMNSRGVLSGYPNGYFYPENNVTRAEFAKIMTVASSLPLDTTSGGVFADVNENDWFKPYVYTAQYYLCGYNMNGGVYYLPNTNALREDIAVALVKLKGYGTTGYDESMLRAMFKDYLSISDYARPYVAIALEKGLISGYEDNTFRGQNSITRAEAATLLWRAYQYGSGNKVSTDKTPYVPTTTPAPNVSVATPIPTIVPTATPEPIVAPTPTTTPTLEPTPTPEPEYTWEVDTLVDDVGDILRMAYYKDGIIYRTNDSVMAVDADGNSEVIFSCEERANDITENSDELSKLEKQDFKVRMLDVAVNHYTNEIYVLLSDNINGKYMYNINTKESYKTSGDHIYCFFKNGDYITDILKGDFTVYHYYPHIAVLKADKYTLTDIQNGGTAGNTGSFCVINEEIYCGINKYNWSTSKYEEIDVDNKGNLIAYTKDYIYMTVEDRNNYGGGDGILRKRSSNGTLYKMNTDGDSELILSAEDKISVNDRKSFDITSIYYVKSDSSDCWHALYAINENDEIIFYDKNTESIRILKQVN